MGSYADWESERARILDVGVSAIDMEDAVATIDRWIANRTPNFVCITGVHGVIESQTDARLRAIHNEAGMVTPDGMPLVWVGRRLGYRNMKRVYGPDLMRIISARSPERGYRHFYYGGAPGTPEKLAATLTKVIPGLSVVGTYSPPFRPLTPNEDAEIMARITATKPDIVWVGLSTPKQEYWMASHVRRLNGPVLIGVGAAFDFLSGNTKQAPRWMQRSGLEWLYRLMSEPRRLWRRYLRIVPLFIVLMCGQLLGWKSRNATNNA